MLSLPLDPTDDRAKPVFKNAATCAEWLGQLQFTNLNAAHSTVRAQLNEFNHYPMRGLERLRTLELLGETVAHLQADYAKKLAAKKLPLSEEEYSILVSIAGLWQDMVIGYQRCLQTLLAGDKQLLGDGALLSARCLFYTSAQIFEYQRAGYEFSGELWQQLHELYAYSEQMGWQQKKLTDRISVGRGIFSCHVVYVKTLLTCYANPVELSRSQTQLLDLWLTKWSTLIQLERNYTAGKSADAPPLAVDLAGTRGLQPASQSNQTDSMRYLAMMPLSKLLRVNTILLQQGKSPKQMDLGEESSGVDCADFLKYLHRHWCETHGERVATRRGADQQALVFYGLEDIYARIANKSFNPKGVGEDSLAFKQIATFGRALSEDKRQDPANQKAEVWRIKDESILGARLLREKPEGIRIGPNQLVAVCPDDTNAIVLGTISWALVTLTKQVFIGVRYNLPGIAQALIIRTTGVNPNTPGNAAPAMLLPAISKLKTPPSLVIPRGWFQPDRVVEIAHLDNKTLKVKMGISVESGLDYERVSFTPV